MDIPRFILIDGIVELDVAAKSIECVSKVDRGGMLFDSHFPGMPLLPGVLQIEMMAQASGLLIGHLHNADRMPIVTSMAHVRLRKPVKPDTNLHIYARLEYASECLAATTAQVCAGGQLKSKAQLRFVLIDYPNVTVRQHIAYFREHTSRHLS